MLPACLHGCAACCPQYDMNNIMHMQLRLGTASKSCGAAWGCVAARPNLGSITCQVAPHNKLHRKHAAAPHDGDVGVGHCQQRIGRNMLRAVHPPCACLVQHLTLHAAQALSAGRLTRHAPSTILTLGHAPLNSVQSKLWLHTLYGIEAKMRSKADCRSVVTITSLSPTSYVSRTLP